jgi:hypothetical protein
MAIDFPNSPTAGQSFTVGAKTWTYVVPSLSIGSTGPGGGIVFITPSTVGNSTGNYFEASPSGWSGGEDPTRTWAQSTPVNYQTSVVTGADGTTIGTGYQNTLDIIAQGNNNPTTSAAALAQNYTGGGKTDWFLPSIDELAQIGNQKLFIGGLSGLYYWSSSEHLNTTSAKNYYMQFNFQSTNSKSVSTRVRPIRSFTTEGGRWVVVDNNTQTNNQIYDIMVLMKMETN